VIMAELRRDRERLEVSRRHDGEVDDDASLKVLLRRLSSDASQLAHDELELAKMELRDISDALRNDVREAGRTLAKDIAKVGVALTLASLGGLALTAGAILAIGDWLDSYWAGALIVGVVLLVAALIAGRSAATDARDSHALRLENTRRTLQEDRDLLRDEVQETKDFARREAQELKRHATQHHH